MAAKWPDGSLSFDPVEESGGFETFREHAFEVKRFRQSHELPSAGIGFGRETGGTYREFRAGGYWTFIPLWVAPGRLAVN